MGLQEPVGSIDIGRNRWIIQRIGKVRLVAQVRFDLLEGIVGTGCSLRPQSQRVLNIGRQVVGKLNIIGLERRVVRIGLPDIGVSLRGRGYSPGLVERHWMR